MLEEALKYAEMGWCIYPIRKKTKIPAIRDWPRRASNQRPQICGWWRKWPDANIGLSLEPSKIVAIDQDVKGGGPDNWNELCGALEYWDHTVTSITGSGGRHALYKAPEVIRIKNSNGILAPGIEVKYKGTGITLPPSIHENGNAYRWEDGLDPFSHQLEPFPQVIIERLQEIERVRETNIPEELKSHLESSEIITEGGRDVFLFNFAVKLRMAGMNEPGIAEALLIINKIRCKPPLPEQQVRDKAKSVSKNKAGRVDQKPIVKYVTNRDQISELFERILEIIVPSRRFFAYGNNLVYIEPGYGPVVLNRENLNGILLQYLEVKNVSRTREDQDKLLNYEMISHGKLLTFLNNPEVRGAFPRLVTYSRVPVVDKDWNIVSEPGFNADPGIYYDGPPIQPSQETKYLDQMLRDVHWKSPSDRANLIGVLLTGLTVSMWPGRHPLVALNGNRSQVGKSTVGRMIGIILGGEKPATISYHHDQAEMEKVIATEILNGQKVVIIDNVKGSGSINSPVVERCITDQILNFRQLGKNSSITTPNDVTFVTTMNDSKFSKDLQNRDIPINLEVLDRPKDIEYSIANIDAWVMEHRLDIIAELLDMIRKWKELGAIVDSEARHTLGGNWAPTIDSILKANGITGFLENYDESNRAFDADYDLIVEICEKYHDREAMQPIQWAETLRPGMLKERLCDNKGNPKPNRAQAIVIGRLFSGYIGERLSCDSGDYTLSRTQISSRPLRFEYKFNRINGMEPGIRQE